MNFGKIIAQGNPHQLLDSYFKGVTLHIPHEDSVLTSIPASLGAHRNGDFIEMHVTDVHKSLYLLLNQGISLEKLSIHKPTLDDLFIHVTENGRGS